MKRVSERRWTAGLILIAVGLGLFLLRRWEGVGSVIALVYVCIA